MTTPTGEGAKVPPEKPYQNTDVTLWEENPDDAFSPTIILTKQGGIGIKVGGTIYVKPIKLWHQLAEKAAAPTPVASANGGAGLVKKLAAIVERAMKVRLEDYDEREFENDDEAHAAQRHAFIKEQVSALTLPSQPPASEEVAKLRAAEAERDLHILLLKQRNAENAETMEEAVKIEDERNDLKRKLAAAESKAALAGKLAEVIRSRGVFAYMSKHLTSLQNEYQKAKDKGLPNPYPGADEATLADIKALSSALDEYDAAQTASAPSEAQKSGTAGEGAP